MINKDLFRKIILMHPLKNKRIIAGVVLFAGVLCTGLFVQTSVNSASNLRSVKLLDGKIIQVAPEITKVAALYGPSYEKLVMLGAEDKIVICADNHKNMWPWANVIYKRVKDIPVSVINASQDPNIEELLKAAPDVAFYWNYSEPLAKIQSVGIPVVYYIDTNDIKSLKDVLSTYAEVIGGNAQKIAQEYADYFDRKLNMVTDITSKIPDAKRPTVYYAVRKALATGGKVSTIPSIVDYAGGLCVTRDLDANFGTEINIEQLMAWNPQVIVIDHCGSQYYASAPSAKLLSDISKDPRFINIDAVKNKRVYVSPTGTFFWDAGQQGILQVIWMAKLLHPDLFKNVNMSTELKEFYAKFFKYKLSDREAELILAHQPPEGMKQTN